MTSTLLRQKLSYNRLNKNAIDQLVAELLHYPELTKPLLDEVFAQDATTELFNASWVFDHLMRKKLIYLLPYIEAFLKGTAKLKSESCMRPMAHVVELLNEAYFKKKKPTFTKAITDEHQKQMVAICFDWLIEEHKVATKVFAMTSLFYLGEKYAWIRPELRSVIELQMPTATAGFKNRGGKILLGLKNLGY